MVLDVRTAAEFAAGHVPGARNVSHDLLASRIDELAAARDKQVVLYCRSGRRTLLAEDILRKAGFKKLAHLEGDYLAWEAEKQPRGALTGRLTRQRVCSSVRFQRELRAAVGKPRARLRDRHRRCTPSGSDSPSRSLRMLMKTNRFDGIRVVHVQVEPQIRKLRALRQHLVA